MGSMGAGQEWAGQEWGMGGARWRGRHARHSTAFHAITVVILQCFTVFHVELSVNARVL